MKRWRCFLSSPPTSPIDVCHRRVRARASPPTSPDVADVSADGLMTVKMLLTESPTKNTTTTEEPTRTKNTATTAEPTIKTKTTTTTEEPTNNATKNTTTTDEPTIRTTTNTTTAEQHTTESFEDELMALLE